MSLSSSLNPKLPSEPFSHPPGAPREPEVDQCTICPELGEETIRPEQAQDSLDPSEYFHGGPRGTEPAANAPRTPAPSSHEETAGSKVHERPVSGHDVLEAEHDSLQLCLLGLGLRLQDMEQGLRPWTLAQSGMAQLQALQAELRGAAERVDSLLAFGEGLVQRSEPMAWASLEQILRTLRAYRHTIFRRLWQLQAQLVSYSLVFEKANTLDRDLEVEGDSDGPGLGGVWGSWAPSNLLTPAELEWDPAADVGDLGVLGQKTAQAPGIPCELCGQRGPRGRGQSLEVRAVPFEYLPFSQATTELFCLPLRRVLVIQGLGGSVCPSLLMSLRFLHSHYLSLSSWIPISYFSHSPFVSFLFFFFFFCLFCFYWYQGSNSRLPACKAGAYAAELNPQPPICFFFSPFVSICIFSLISFRSAPYLLGYGHTPGPLANTQMALPSWGSQGHGQLTSPQFSFSSGVTSERPALAPN
ncbi:nesprin-4 isoform X1 [Cavia porcellus]|uniref:nesprin-4 isoform X1 n=1 Tax=Cavia porcellus TaxID=10141 RepID=UPI002FDF8D47